MKVELVHSFGLLLFNYDTRIVAAAEDGISLEVPYVLFRFEQCCLFFRIVRQQNFRGVPNRRGPVVHRRAGQVSRYRLGRVHVAFGRVKVF